MNLEKKVTQRFPFGDTFHDLRQDSTRNQITADLSPEDASSIEAEAPAPDWVPRKPKDLSETGLSEYLVAELILKALHPGFQMHSRQLAERLCLPFHSILDPILSTLQADALVEVKGGAGLDAGTWRYALTDKGRFRGFELREQNQYSGPAPVSLEEYVRITRAQLGPDDVTLEDLRAALSGLVLEESLLNRLGAALSSRRSILLYGPPGNGKSTIAERMRELLHGSIYVPHAVEIDGQIMKVHDPIVHVPPTGFQSTCPHDPRWVLCRRPMLICGGELTLNMLDLIHNPVLNFYEAPLHVKSNGGIVFIDDIGRHSFATRDLFNRWIIPLEKQRDYLTLHTGKKFEVPFHQLVIFSMNDHPDTLGDGWFLRRVRYKIEVEDPTEEAFRSIWERVCAERAIRIAPGALDHLIARHYRLAGRPFRGCHPHDLVEIILDAAQFVHQPATLDQHSIEEACTMYFVSNRREKGTKNGSRS